MSRWKRNIEFTLEDLANVLEGIHRELQLLRKTLEDRLTFLAVALGGTHR